MTKGGYLSEDSIKTYNEFQRQAAKIHDMHIRQEINADVEIAEKRIKKYFNGELQLTWKSIIYEINKLPELQRNKYFKDLVEREKMNTSENIYNSLKNLKLTQRIKFILKGL